MDFMYAYLGACGCSESARIYFRVQFAIFAVVLSLVLFQYAGTHFQSAVGKAVAYYCPQAESTTVKSEQKHVAGHSKLSHKKATAVVAHK